METENRPTNPFAQVLLISVIVLTIIVILASFSLYSPSGPFNGPYLFRMSPSSPQGNFNPTTGYQNGYSFTTAYNMQVPGRYHLATSASLNEAARRGYISCVWGWTTNGVAQMFSGLEGSCNCGKDVCSGVVTLEPVGGTNYRGLLMDAYYYGYPPSTIPPNQIYRIE